MNSADSNIVGGTLQYYEAGWKNAVNNNDGTFTVATTLKTVNLRMSYAYGSQTRSHVPVGRDTVLFQTTNVQVRFQNSSGLPMDAGAVQYYAAGWRAFGTIDNGTASKELLPDAYPFKLTYESVSIEKGQDVGSNNSIGFSTVLCTVRVMDPRGRLLDNAQASYFSDGWHAIGSTLQGDAKKELLPAPLLFRVTYDKKQQDKSQDLRKNTIVEFVLHP